MFSSDITQSKMNNLDALRAILNTVNENPDNVFILINLPSDSPVFNINYNESVEAVVNVTLHTEDYKCYGFNLNIYIKGLAQSKVSNLTHEDYLVRVRQDFDSKKGYPLQFFSIDKHGQTHRESEVTLTTDDIEHEIRMIFDIVNERMIGDDSYDTIAYHVEFDEPPILAAFST